MTFSKEAKVKSNKSLRRIKLALPTNRVVKREQKGLSASNRLSVIFTRKFITLLIAVIASTFPAAFANGLKPAVDNKTTVEMKVLNSAEYRHLKQLKQNLPKKLNVLLFTKTAGFKHNSIPNGIEAVNLLARIYDFNLVHHNQASFFQEGSLENFDVLIFLSTTGNILSRKQQKVVERFIEGGKGFVGVHSASDTEYGWPWYQKMIGHSFAIHPKNQTATLIKLQSDFPGLSNMAKEKSWFDEWYEFSVSADKPAKNADLNYILTVDEASYQPYAKWGEVEGKGMGEFHPIAWTHNYQGGRAFYTALGHVKSAYKESFFLNHLYGGIYWAALNDKL